MSFKTINTRPVTTAGRRCALTGVIASIVFVVLLAALHVVRPDLDPTWRFVSEYALGPARPLMTIAFLSLAVASASVVAVYWGQARTIAGRIGVVLAGVSGAGMIIAAIFPTDPITTAPEDATVAGTLHLVGGQLNLTPFAILLITIGLRKSLRWRSVRTAQWVIVAASLAATGGFIASSVTVGDGFGPGVLAGLFGRLMLLSFAAWVIVSGIPALRLIRAGDTATPERPQISAMRTGVGRAAPRKETR